MVDKIKPLKIENPATGGTSLDFYPTEANPLQDYISTLGIAFKGEENVTIRSDGSNIMWFKDSQVTPEISLLGIKSGVANSRFILGCMHNGTLTTNQFLYRSETVTAEIVFPRAVRLLEISLANGSVNVQGQIKFRLTSQTGTIFYTWTFASGATLKTATVSGLTLDIPANTVLWVQYTKTGGNTLSDLAIDFYMQVI